jgi:hypothetical protein
VKWAAALGDKSFSDAQLFFRIKTITKFSGLKGPKVYYEILSYPIYFAKKCALIVFYAYLNRHYESREMWGTCSRSSHKLRDKTQSILILLRIAVYLSAAKTFCRVHNAGKHK